MDQQRYIETRTGGISCRRRRTGGPVLLCLHGSGFSTRVFDRLILSPSYDRFDLITLDLPGHGMSANANEPEKTYCFDGFADVIRDAIDAMELDQVTLFGWSLGGHVAVSLLNKCDAVSAAVSVAAPPLRPTTLSSLNAFHFTFDMLNMSRPKLSTRQADRFERAALGQAAKGKHIADIMRTDPAMRPSLSSATMRGQFADQYAALCQSSKPVCVVAAEDDPLVNAASVRGLLRDPDYFGYGSILERGGHAPFLTEPILFEKAVMPFLDVVAGDASSVRTADTKAA